jgi:hypothetical protein
MKLIYGGVPYNTTKVRHFETSTNGATAVNSAVQAGLTYYANGRKEVGTGKSFEFAMYGDFEANDDWFIPTEINVIHISCSSYPTLTEVDIMKTLDLDFSQGQVIGKLIADNAEYPITVTVLDNIITIACDKIVTFQVFYGKDNYI